MDKALLLNQLQQKLEATTQQALRFADDARREAKTGAPRAVNLAAATKQRAEAALAALEALHGFTLPIPKKGAPIGLGSIVEIEDEAGGKTLFVAPVGAGEELTGPGGDGFLHVVTPGAPLGRALMGKRMGDVVEVTLGGELTEWEIVYVG